MAVCLTGLISCLFVYMPSDSEEMVTVGVSFDLD